MLLLSCIHLFNAFLITFSMARRSIVTTYFSVNPKACSLMTIKTCLSLKLSASIHQLQRSGLEMRFAYREVCVCIINIGISDVSKVLIPFPAVLAINSEDMCPRSKISCRSRKFFSAKRLWVRRCEMDLHRRPLIVFSNLESHPHLARFLAVNISKQAANTYSRTETLAKSVICFRGVCTSLEIGRATSRVAGVPALAKLFRYCAAADYGGYRAARMSSISANRCGVSCSMRSARPMSLVCVGVWMPERGAFRAWCTRVNTKWLGSENGDGTREQMGQDVKGETHQARDVTRYN